MTPIASSLLLVASLLAGTAAPAQARGGGGRSGARGDADSAPNVLVAYDLRSVLPTYDGLEEWNHGLIVQPGDPYGGSPRVDLANLFVVARPDTIVDLVTQVLGDELRYEGRNVYLEGDARLLVVAPPSSQAKVAALLGVLESAFAATVDLRVDVLTLSQGGEAGWPARCVVDPAEADRIQSVLVERGAERRTHEVHLSVGKLEGIEAMRHVPFVGEYDVEIAQGANIQDPIVFTAEVGQRLLVRGVPARGGTHLSIVLQSSELVGGIRDQELSIQGMMSTDTDGVQFVAGPKLLQTAEVSFRAFAFNTFLPDAKVLVAAAQTDISGRQETEVVLVRRTGGTATSVSTSALPDTGRRILLLDAELLRPPELVPRLDTSYSDSTPFPNAWVTMRSAPSLFLLDWMRSNFSDWYRFGAWGIALSDPAWSDDAPQRFAELITQGPEAVEPRQVFVDLSGGEGRARHAARFCLPVRSGSGSAVVLGTTTTVLYDYDVEVAQFAAVADPVMRPLFQGLALAVTPSSGATPALEVRGMANLLAQSVKDLSLESPVHGVVQLPQLDILRFDERTSLRRADGSEAVLRLGGDDPARTPVLEVRMR